MAYKPSGSRAFRFWYSSMSSLCFFCFLVCNMGGLILQVSIATVILEAKAGSSDPKLASMAAVILSLKTWHH